jgi:uncharacterized membrane protein
MDWTETVMSGMVKLWTTYTAVVVQAGAAAMIAAAVTEAVAGAMPVLLHVNRSPDASEVVRLRLGRWLVLALEFLLAADILKTMVTPSWNDIGQLAAIVVLRTALNYFLQREISRAAARPSARTACEPAGEA